MGDAAACQQRAIGTVWPASMSSSYYLVCGFSSNCLISNSIKSESVDECSTESNLFIQCPELTQIIIMIVVIIIVITMIGGEAVLIVGGLS